MEAVEAVEPVAACSHHREEAALEVTPCGRCGTFVCERPFLVWGGTKRVLARVER